MWPQVWQQKKSNSRSLALWTVILSVRGEWHFGHAGPGARLGPVTMFGSHRPAMEDLSCAEVSACGSGT